MTSVSRLVIDQQYAEIGIKITNAQMKITTHLMKMKVQNEIPEMKLDTQKPTFEMNWTKVFSEIGNKTSGELSKSARDNAKNATMAAIATISSDGDYLGSTEQKGDRVASLARRKSLAADNKEINIGLKPQSMPEITWNKGHINVDWTEKRFQIEWDGEYMPELVIDPKHSVEIFLRNHPKVTITVAHTDEASMNSRYINTTL